VCSEKNERLKTPRGLNKASREENSHTVKANIFRKRGERAGVNSLQGKKRSAMRGSGLVGGKVPRGKGILKETSKNKGQRP